MDPEHIFTYRYQRLADLLKGGDSHQLLDVSGILREFLIDSPNIVDLVNREQKLKIQYLVYESSRAQYEQAKTPDTIFMMVMVGTTRPPNAPMTPLSRDEFLKHEIMSVQDLHFNVRQVVKACSNKFGGRHYEDAAKDDQETAALRYLDTHFAVAGASGVFSSLRLVGEITLEALRELYNRTSSNASAT